LDSGGLAVAVGDGFNGILGASLIGKEVEQKKFPTSDNTVSITFCYCVGNIHVEGTMIH